MATWRLRRKVEGLKLGRLPRRTETPRFEPGGLSLVAVIHVYRCIQHIIRTLLATSNLPPPSEEPPEVIELEPFSDADDIPIQLTTITGDIPVRMIGEEIPRRQNPAPTRTNKGLPGNCLNGYLRRRPIRTILRYRQMGRFQRVAPICASRRYGPLRFGIWFLLRPTKQLSLPLQPLVF